MDYSKLDAALAGALDADLDADDASLTVFIHTHETPGAGESARLKELGVNDPAGMRRLFTATLSPRALAALSGEVWIKYIELSGTVQPRPRDGS